MVGEFLQKDQKIRMKLLAQKLMCIEVFLMLIQDIKHGGMKEKILESHKLHRKKGHCINQDSWREGEESVTWEAILKVFHENAEKVKQLLVKVIPRIKVWVLEEIGI